MNGSKEYACRECGVAVMWRTAKSGKRYLAQRKDWHGEERMASRCYWPAHVCTPNPEWQAEAAAAEAARVATATAEGRVERGVTVVVVKGRKVAHGTTGRVFWLADAEDDFGVVKVGIVTDAGDKHYLNVANVAVAS